MARRAAAQLSGPLVSTGRATGDAQCDVHCVLERDTEFLGRATLATDHGHGPDLRSLVDISHEIVSYFTRRICAEPHQSRLDRGDRLLGREAECWLGVPDALPQHPGRQASMPARHRRAAANSYPYRLRQDHPTARQANARRPQSSGTVARPLRTAGQSRRTAVGAAATATRSSTRDIVSRRCPAERCIWWESEGRVGARFVVEGRI